jgi:hypothetical protein
MGAASQCRWLVRVQARWIGGGELESEATCDRTAQNSSVLSPKPVHVAIKQ